MQKEHERASRIVNELVAEIRLVGAAVKVAGYSIPRWRVLARLRMRITANTLAVLAQSTRDRQAQLVRELDAVLEADQ